MFGGGVYCSLPATAKPNVWDASAGQNDGVLACYKKVAGTNYYDIWVQGYNTSDVKSLNGSSADSKKYGVHAGPDLSYMFQNTGVTGGTLKANMLDTSSSTNMRYMLYNTKSIDWNISGWETPKVSDMYGVFYSSVYPGELDLKGWNVSSVKNLSYFLANSKVTGVDISGWDSSLNEDSSYMFYSNPNIQTLDLSQVNMPNIKNLYYMFGIMSGLKTLNLSGWKVNDATNTSCMFYNDTELTSLNMANTEMQKVQNASYMFYGLTKLTSLNVSSLGMNNATNMSYMFANIPNVTSLDLSNWANTKVTNTSYMFNNDSKMNNLNLSGIDMSQISSMTNMLNGAKSTLKTLNLSNWKISSSSYDLDFLKNSSASGRYTNLILQNWTYYIQPKNLLADVNANSVDLSGWKNTGQSDMSKAFVGLKSENISYINISNWNTSSVTDMSYMFAAYDGSNETASSLTNVNVSNSSTYNVTNMEGLFRDDENLLTISFRNLNISKITSLRMMFWDCKKVSDLSAIAYWNTSNITDFGFVFYGMSSLANINVSNWNTSKATDMTAMFWGTAVSALNVSNFVVNNVRIFDNMFGGMPNITAIDLNGWNFVAYSEYYGTNVGSMFKGSTKLKKVYLPSSIANTGKYDRWTQSDHCTYTNLAYVFYSYSGRTCTSGYSPHDNPIYDESHTNGLNVYYEGSSIPTVLSTHRDNITIKANKTHAQYLSDDW